MAKIPNTDFGYWKNKNKTSGPSLSGGSEVYHPQVAEVIHEPRVDMSFTKMLHRFGSAPFLKPRSRNVHVQNVHALSEQGPESDPTNGAGPGVRGVAHLVAPRRDLALPEAKFLNCA